MYGGLLKNIGRHRLNRRFPSPWQRWSEELHLTQNKPPNVVQNISIPPWEMGLETVHYTALAERTADRTPVWLIGVASYVNGKKKKKKCTGMSSIYNTGWIRVKAEPVHTAPITITYDRPKHRMLISVHGARLQQILAR